MTRENISDLLRNGISLVHLRNPAGLFDNDRDSRCFDFFRSFSAPKSTIFHGSDFWLRRVLQMSHSEPAIRDATLALSSLHRYYESEQLPQSDQERRSAILYYGRAVSQTKRLLSQNARDNIEKLLVTCVMFICYENLAGNFPDAQMHLQNGLRILSESQNPLSEGQLNHHRAIPDDILHIFSRCNLQAMMFSESSAPYPFATIPISEPGPIPSSFSSVAEAQYHLFEHFKWRWVEEEMFHDANVQSPLLRHSWLGSGLTTWEDSFAALQLRQREGPPNAEMELGLIITQINCEIFTLVFSSVFTRTEISYDAHYAKFERMLTLLESLPVVSDSGPAGAGKPLGQKTISFEWGVIPPLYFIVVRCRDPCLRRQALARLYALHRVEGVWDSLGAARVAERVVQIEEEGLESVERADEIGNEKRVIDAYVLIEMDQHIIFLTCTLKPDPDGPIQTITDIISF